MDRERRGSTAPTVDESFSDLGGGADDKLRAEPDPTPRYPRQWLGCGR